MSRSKPMLRRIPFGTRPCHQPALIRASAASAEARATATCPKSCKAGVVLDLLASKTGSKIGKTGRDLLASKTGCKTGLLLRDLKGEYNIPCKTESDLRGCNAGYKNACKPEPEDDPRGEDAPHGEVVTTDGCGSGGHGRPINSSVESSAPTAVGAVYARSTPETTTLGTGTNGRRWTAVGAADARSTPATTTIGTGANGRRWTDGCGSGSGGCPINSSNQQSSAPTADGATEARSTPETTTLVTLGTGTDTDRLIQSSYHSDELESASATAIRLNVADTWCLVCCCELLKRK